MHNRSRLSRRSEPIQHLRAILGFHEPGVDALYFIPGLRELGFGHLIAPPMTTDESTGGSASDRPSQRGMVTAA